MRRWALRLGLWSAALAAALALIAFGTVWKIEGDAGRAALITAAVARSLGSDGVSALRAWWRGPGVADRHKYTFRTDPRDGDRVFAAMRQELDRSRKLRLDGVEEPYWIAYTVRESRQWEAQASLGALLRRSDSRRRGVRVEVRVGSEELDNSRFARSQDWSVRPETESLPLEDGVTAIRTALWRATDAAYKDALDRLAKKRSEVDEDSRPDDRGPAETGNSFSEGPAPDAPPPAGLDVEDLAKKLSWTFRGRRAVRSAEATVGFARVRWRRLDTEDDASRIDQAWLHVKLEVGWRTRDSRELEYEAQFLYPALGRPPSEDDILADARRLAADVERQAAGRGPEDYVGPVLFVGQAAGEFFNQALADPVSFPRGWDSDDDDLARRMGPGGLAGRLGMQVAPAFLSAELDPTAEEEQGRALAGHYWVDDEGVRARRHALLEKGRLKGLAMSRAPVKGLGESNGHARAPLAAWPEGRVSNLFVSGAGGEDRAALKERLKALAKEAGLASALVVTRMDRGSERKEGAFFARPAMAWLVSVEGDRVEPVNGLEFAEASLAVLKEIAAVSADRTVYNLYQTGPARLDTPLAVPAAIVAPDVLVREMALRRPPEDPKDKDVIESPMAAQADAAADDPAGEPF